MPDTPTPGQVARDAYWGVLGPQYHPCTPHDWAQLSPACQAAWEAAAQAVLDAWQAQPRLETAPVPEEPTPIELPRCTYCEAYASDTVRAPEGLVLYVCETHYDQWLASQEGMP